MNEHRDELEEELKALIIDVLALEDLEPADIADEDPLFGEGLGLDSIDALEISVALEQRYGVGAEDDPKLNEKRFACIASLAEFVRSSAGRREGE